MSNYRTAKVRSRTTVTVQADRQVRVARIGIPGPPGTGTGTPLPANPLPSRPAATALSALRVVSGDGTSYAYSNPANANSVWSIAGLTPTAIAQGADCIPIRDQSITDGGWNWDTSKPIVLGANGTLVQADTLTGWMVVVARPLSPTTIYIDIKEPIEL